MDFDKFINIGYTRKLTDSYIKTNSPFRVLAFEKREGKYGIFYLLYCLFYNNINPYNDSGKIWFMQHGLFGKPIKIFSNKKLNLFLKEREDVWLKEDDKYIFDEKMPLRFWAEENVYHKVFFRQLNIIE